MRILSGSAGTFCASLLVVLTGLTAPAPAVPALPAPPRAAAPLASTGYILGDSSAALVARDAHGLATLGVDGVVLTRGGRSTTRVTDGMLDKLAAAHQAGIRAEVLLSNYSGELGDFDPRSAARLLRDPELVRSTAARLAAYVAAQGWDGVQVDLESMRRKDGAGLVQLVQELQARMAPEKTVSIAVMASTDPGEYARRGYRLGPIGAAVDTLTLMTYDQHGPWSGPGPIGSLPWQRSAVQVVTAAVPAAKVDLGVAGYGYGWPHGRTYTVEQARKAVARDGAEARWKAGPGEWVAKLSDGTLIWWSDGRSYALRLELATALGLHGVSLWRLGSADPLP